MEDLIRRTVGPKRRGGGGRRGGPVADAWSIRASSRTRCSTSCINARDAMPDGGRSPSRPPTSGWTSAAARERDLPPGQYVSLSRHRHRHRHDARGDRARLRPVLHHQADRPGHRPGPVDDLWLRRASPAARCGSIPRSARARPCASTCRRFARRVDAAEPPRRRGAASADAGRDRAGGGRRANGAHADRRSAGRGSATACWRPPTAPPASKILQSDARIDLLVTDVGLPGGMNGRQVADAARAAPARI